MRYSFVSIFLICEKLRQGCERTGTKKSRGSAFCDTIQLTMTKLNPFLRFNDGKCREAMEFYKSIFGGKVEYMTIGESPMAKDMPKEKQGFIMHAELKKGDLIFYGSDMMRDKAVVGDNVGMALNCESEKEIRTLYTKLSKSGEVFCKLEDAFWGALFGVVIDRYGVEWMLNYQKKK